MKNLNNVALLTRDDIVTVKCVYGRDSAEYTFVCKQALADTLEIGDWVLTTKSESRGFRSMKVAQVDEVADIDVDAEFTYAWVFQKIDFTTINELEEEMAEVVKKLKVMQREHARRQALQSMGIYAENMQQLTASVNKAEAKGDSNE